VVVGKGCTFVVFVLCFSVCVVFLCLFVFVTIGLWPHFAMPFLITFVLVWLKPGYCRSPVPPGGAIPLRSLFYNYNYNYLVFKAWQHATKRSAVLRYFDETNAATSTECLEDTQHQNKILHLYNCTRAYLTLVHAPQEWGRRQHIHATAHKRAMRGKLKFWVRYTCRALKHQQETERKRQHRDNKISARTRGIDQHDRQNLNENLWENKRKVTADTKYEGMHRWPHRDKIGRVLSRYITYIKNTNCWPEPPHRKRRIPPTPENTQEENISLTPEKSHEEPSDHPDDQRHTNGNTTLRKSGAARGGRVHPYHRPTKTATPRQNKKQAPKTATPCRHEEPDEDRAEANDTPSTPTPTPEDTTLDTLTLTETLLTV